MSKPSRSVTVVIPARYGSSRFPGKAVEKLNGKPMIQHEHELAVARHAVSDTVVSVLALGDAGE